MTEEYQENPKDERTCNLWEVVETLETVLALAVLTVLATVAMQEKIQIVMEVVGVSLNVSVSRFSQLQQGVFLTWLDLVTACKGAHSPQLIHLWPILVE